MESLYQICLDFSFEELNNILQITPVCYQDFIRKIQRYGKKEGFVFMNNSDFTKNLGKKLTPQVRSQSYWKLEGGCEFFNRLAKIIYRRMG